jgi:hypothetical protein
LQAVVFGVDVDKDRLDDHHLGRSVRQIGNAPAMVRSFAAASAKAGLWVILEAAGG